MDKATVLGEAIDYVKRLQERVRELENNEKKRKRRGGGGRVRKEKTSTEKCWCCRAQEAVEVPEMEVRVLENEVLVRVQCEGRRDMMRKTVELLEHVHLPVSCCNSLAFGNSALSITMVAQMKDQYKMKVNDLIKYLRQHLFESQDVR
ncbi:transcription factor bHLH25-like [Neltuma alba]|uniref:transcription factor bHLH25-like n=1 Tax=Neltuma alba TaxID=207710 RepID=UPI0010A35FCF|nr:transcription factor bHLH25-like [Prosopis alba]